MSRRRRRIAIVAAVAGAVAVVVTLVVLSVPMAEVSSGYQMIGPRLFAFESESLFGAAWSNYSFRGVQFEFHLWCSAGPGGGVVCGSAGAPGADSYPYAFTDGPPQVDPSWQTWVSPDGHEAVEYRMGGQVHLLVAV